MIGLNTVCTVQGVLEDSEMSLFDMRRLNWRALCQTGPRDRFGSGEWVWRGFGGFTRRSILRKSIETSSQRTFESISAELEEYEEHVKRFCVSRTAELSPLAAGELLR